MNELTATRGRVTLLYDGVVRSKGKFAKGLFKGNEINTKKFSLE